MVSEEGSISSFSQATADESFMEFNQTQDGCSFVNDEKASSLPSGEKEGSLLCSFNFANSPPSQSHTTQPIPCAAGVMPPGATIAYNKAVSEGAAPSEALSSLKPSEVENKGRDELLDPNDQEVSEVPRQDESEIILADST